MSSTVMLIKRNVKLFFKDKGMFFTSLITPVILLVLYATFLSNVYTDIFWNFFATFYKNIKSFTPNKSSDRNNNFFIRYG